jgi:hypothetical protein
MKREPTSPICPKRGCMGAMFDVSSRLAAGLGVMHLRCDKCDHRIAVRVKPEDKAA